MQPATHLGINHALCGTPVELSDGSATVQFQATPEMSADDHGLVHGGFIFGLADHAAMLVVNHPNVVLGAAEVRFLAPVRVGETAVATALLKISKGRKHTIETSVQVGDKEVFKGSFTAFVLDKHVLDD